MKKITLLFCSMMLLSVAFSQTGPPAGQAGSNCNNAIHVFADTTCGYSSYSTNKQEMWFRFTANSPDVRISVVSKSFELNLPHMHHVSLYKNNCNGLELIDSYNLPLKTGAKELTVHASDLTFGQQYRIRIRRSGDYYICDKTGCTGSTTSGFDLCVQSLLILTPPDFDGEPHSEAHLYLKNEGQLTDLNGEKRPDLKYYTQFASPQVFLSDQCLSYVFFKGDSAPNKDSLHRVDMCLVNESYNVLNGVHPMKPSFSGINYFLGHIPEGRKNVRQYERLTYPEVYPRIDFEVYSNPKGIKYYFVMKPGGNPAAINMQFTGMTECKCKPTGELEIRTIAGSMVFEKADAYQVGITGNLIPLPWQPDYVENSNGSISFAATGYYDPSLPLVFQMDKGETAAPPPPANNSWSAYISGNGDDLAYDADVDGAGNVYVTGETGSNLFPQFNGFQPIPGGLEDVFIGKFDLLAKRLWLTFYGGSNKDYGFGIAYDSYLDRVYFTGTTYSGNFPFPQVNSGIYVQPNKAGGNRDAYIVKLRVDSGIPEWASYFGGTGNDEAHGIDTDASGNIYLTGWTGSTVTLNTCGVAPSGEFPICNPGGGAYVQDWNKNNGTFDGFVTMFNANGKLVWNTLFGGWHDDMPFVLKVDDLTGNVYIAGSTDSDESISDNFTSPCAASGFFQFPVCNPGGGAFYQSIHANANGTNPNSPDGFIAQFDPSHQLTWSSYFGTGGADEIEDIAINSKGEVFITGTTKTNSISFSTSCDATLTGPFPTCNPGGGAYVQQINGGNDEAFIAQFSKSGKMLWSSFYGGKSDDKSDYEAYRGGGGGIAIDANDNIYITGTTEGKSADNEFPVKNLAGAYYQPANKTPTDTSDCFVVAFNAARQRTWASLYGGAMGAQSYNGNDDGFALAAYKSQYLYMLGSTSSESFPQACPVPGVSFCQSPILPQMSRDAFIVRFDLGVTNQVEDEAKDHDNWLLYPNPTNGTVSLQIRLKEKQNVIISVYSTLGQLVYRKTEENRVGVLTKQIDLSRLLPGIYAVQVETGQTTYNRKIVRQ